MLCDVCGVDFPHSPLGVLKYGRHHMCKPCLNLQTPCQVCGKRRPHKDVFDVCQDCNNVPPTAVPTPLGEWGGFEGGEELDIEQVRETHREIMRDFEKDSICDCCGVRGRMHEAIGKSDLKVCGVCRGHSGKCSGCGKDSFRLQGTSYGKVYCPSCQKTSLEGKEHTWRYVPRVFFKHGKGDFMLGAENEVQFSTVGKREYLDQIAKNFSRTEVYTMYDGTIDYGTEVVFHPRTLASYQKIEYAGMMVGIKPHITTGMHVHIERVAFLNKMHLYKFIRFVMKNHKFIRLIAERDDNTTLNKSWKFTKEFNAISKVKGYPVDPDKYMDVNMQHQKTVELRIFKGATTAEQFLKNLEFAHALTIFSKVEHPRYMTAYRFKLWLGHNGSKYPNLLNFLAGRGK